MKTVFKKKKQTVITIVTQFSINLKNAREISGMSQSELALKIGVAQAQLSRYESGKSNPTLETFDSICRELKTTPNDLLSYKC